MGKNNRFQLFLYEQHERVADCANKAGRSVSAEVRQRVARSFWQDDLVDEIHRLKDEGSGDAAINHLLAFIKAAKAKHSIPREERE